MNMIERVAQVLCCHGFLCCAPPLITGARNCHLRDHIDDAKNVLKAMREPTKKMIWDGDSCKILGVSYSEEVSPDMTWRAMIDAALAEDKK